MCVCVCTCVCVFPYLLLFFSPIVDPVIITEYLADAALRDYETSGVHVAGGLVWCPGLCAG